MPDSDTPDRHVETATTPSTQIHRRTLLAIGGVSGALGLAGCLSDNEDDVMTDDFLGGDREPARVEPRPPRDPPSFAFDVTVEYLDLDGNWEQNSLEGFLTEGGNHYELSQRGGIEMEEFGIDGIIYGVENGECYSYDDTYGLPYFFAGVLTVHKPHPLELLELEPTETREHDDMEVDVYEFSSEIEGERLDETILIDTEMGYFVGSHEEAYRDDELIRETEVTLHSFGSAFSLELPSECVAEEDQD